MIVGQATTFVGVVAVVLIDYLDNDQQFPHYYSPVWAGFSVSTHTIKGLYGQDLVSTHTIIALCGQDSQSVHIIRALCGQDS